MTNFERNWQAGGYALWAGFGIQPKQLGFIPLEDPGPYMAWEAILPDLSTFGLQEAYEAVGTAPYFPSEWEVTNAVEIIVAELQAWQPTLPDISTFGLPEAWEEVGTARFLPYMWEVEGIAVILVAEEQGWQPVLPDLATFGLFERYEAVGTAPYLPFEFPVDGFADIMPAGVGRPPDIKVVTGIADVTVHMTALHDQGIFFAAFVGS